MSLKNLIRKKVSHHGRQSWELRTAHDKVSVEGFRSFCATALQDYRYATRKRYAEAVSRFLDYLYEAGAFGKKPVTATHLNSVIQAYPLLLRDGSEMTAKRVLANAAIAPQDLWLAEAAKALSWNPLRPNSFSNTLAAVNKFLRYSESLAREEFERAELLGIKHMGEHQALIRALDGHTTLSSIEVARMRQNSMFGSVAKFSPKGIQRPRRITSSIATKTQKDRRFLDFPLEFIMQVVNAATCWRDRALWLLLAASGIRISEARNLLLDDVDFERQMVFVEDPHQRHFAAPSWALEEPRFKGRNIAMTYLFPPLRQEFFRALEQYLNLEYVPVSRQGTPRYLFQYVAPLRRGQPLVAASDAALSKSFKKALKAANVPVKPGVGDWTIHSLRHLYGVYMLNDYPRDPATGEFGLSLVDVQMLMGHESIASTKHYARRKEDRLMKKLQAADEALLYLPNVDRERLPLAVIQRLGMSK